MANKEGYYLELMETYFKRMEDEIKNSDNLSFYEIVNNNLVSFYPIFGEMNEENSKLREELFLSINIDPQTMSIDSFKEFSKRVSELNEDESEELFISFGKIVQKFRIYEK